MAAKSYILNYMWTAGSSSIEGRPQVEHRWSKDPYYSLVFTKNLSHKIGLGIGAQAPLISAKKLESTPLMTSPTKKQIQNIAIFLV